MSLRTASLLLLSSGLGCGGGSTATPTDAPGSQIDAPTSAPATITVTGTAKTISLSGTKAAAGVQVSAYLNSDEATAIATATTDATGAYTLMIPTHGVPVDGFLKGTLSGNLDTYLYPPKVLAADFSGASVLLLSSSTLDLGSSICAGMYASSEGALAVEVTDASLTPVPGATVVTTPAARKDCYSGSNALPSGSATVTAADGFAYVFGVTGSATVGATAAGATFATHPVTVRAGVLTTTLVSP